MQVKVVYI